MDEEVNYLLEKFPRHRKRILKAYTNNDEFKGLCHDFYESAQVLEKYQHNVVKNLKGEFEYQRLFADLEQEIVDFLKSKDDA